MSTRSTTHFINSRYINKDTKQPTVTAIIYRHSDGYPEGAGVDLRTFLDQVSQLYDTRFDDASYLAAKYVVYLAEKFTYPESESPLDFLSVGILMRDPGDIEFRYFVDCGKHDETGKPEIRCETANGKAMDIPQ